jgi:hypothetical protein
VGQLREVVVQKFRAKVCPVLDRLAAVSKLFGLKPRPLGSGDEHCSCVASLLCGVALKILLPSMAGWMHLASWLADG